MFEIERISMVETQIQARGIKDHGVINAMKKIPRHIFVKTDYLSLAYSDEPLPIDCNQTISQPYIIALMTASLMLKGSEKILEIGTGSGYQTAILADLCHKVITIERIESLSKSAQDKFIQLDYTNIECIIGDGTLGYPENEPYDCIIVTAGAPNIPNALINQLSIGGKLVIPVGNTEYQDLILYTKLNNDKFDIKNLCCCRFVKLIGSAGWK